MNGRVIYVVDRRRSRALVEALGATGGQAEASGKGWRSPAAEALPWPAENDKLGEREGWGGSGGGVVSRRGTRLGFFPI
jgi:hypothetical protein